jgi:hypothetical protein
VAADDSLALSLPLTEKGAGCELAQPERAPPKTPKGRVSLLLGLYAQPLGLPC